MKKNLEKGFTLIELLVVIAIIGVLSSIILPKLGTARNHANDAKIKQTLAHVKVTASTIVSDSGCYGDGDPGDTTCAQFPVGACDNGVDNTLFKNDGIWQQISSANALGKVTSCIATANGQNYAVAMQMVYDPMTAWCVDSEGASKEVSDAADFTQTTLDAVIATGQCSS